MGACAQNGEIVYPQFAYPLRKKCVLGPLPRPSLARLPLFLRGV